MLSRIRQRTYLSLQIFNSHSITSNEVRVIAAEHGVSAFNIHLPLVCMCYVCSHLMCVTVCACVCVCLCAYVIYGCHSDELLGQSN